MTKLIVKTPDPDEPGYIGRAYRIAEARASLGSDDKGTSFMALVDTLAELSTTDDGTPVRKALEQLTRDQFAEALGQLTESSVPTMSDGS